MQYKSLLCISTLALLSPLAAAAPSYVNDVLADNPTGYWQLNDAVGSSVAADSSGNGNNGTYEGGVVLGVPGPIAGDPATAAQFNGATSYVTANGTPFNWSSGFTLEAWVINNNQGDPTGYPGRIVSNRDITGGYGMGILSTGQVRFTTFTIQDYDSSFDVPFNNAWQYLVVTFDQNFTARFYLDGVLDETIQGSQGANSSSQPLLIGHITDSTEWYNGDIGQVAVYHQVLSAATIMEHCEDGINSAPEPASLAALCLGGLLIRRRVKR